MAWPKETLHRFETVIDHFTQHVEAVRNWDAPTPVAEWEARDVIMHLQGWFPAQMKQAGLDMKTAIDPFDDPAAAWKELAEGAYAVLREYPHAVLQGGDQEGMTVEQVIREFFIPDVFMHTWDLALSQGNQPDMDEDAAEKLLSALISRGDALVTSGHFGAPQACPREASAVQRLMAYVGRDPHYSAGGGASVNDGQA